MTSKYVQHYCLANYVMYRGLWGIFKGRVVGNMLQEMQQRDMPIPEVPSFAQIVYLEMCQVLQDTAPPGVQVVCSVTRAEPGS